jgi:methylase of polypeptide subunit release factors
MLGRVFEGVMDPDLRRASGTFYTPASLVQSLLDAALIALISQKLGCSESEAERRLENPGSRALGVIGTVTILDPAVGSGAFLLGALERLASIDPEQRGAVARKRAVLKRNLFGVDVNPAAVRLAELRLWLAVVADERTDRPGDVRPLPNLDCLIRQGDSLFDPIGPIITRQGHPAPHRRELTALRRQLVTATGPIKRSLVRRLSALEGEALAHSLEWAETNYRAEIAAALHLARGADLFGRRRGLDPSGRSALTRLRQELHRIRQARRRLSCEGGLPWFHYHSHFADVFAGGGFDLVIGNPPWLRSEQIPAGMRQQLAGRYRWWRGGAQPYGKGPDLSVAFLERGLELLAPSGILAMLVPAKITSAGYGAPARHGLASGVTLHAIADLTAELRTEFDALVYPMAIVAAKANPPSGHDVRVGLEVGDGPGINQCELRGGRPWVLLGDGLRNALRELESNHPTLGDRLGSHLGVKTGANRLFLNPPAEVEPDLIRPAIRGRDIRSFHSRSGARLLWTHDEAGQPLATLPSGAAAYLRPHWARLRARRDYRSGPPWTLFRILPSLSRYRVVWADLARQLTAAALTTPRDRQRIPLNSCYVAPMRRRLAAECLCAWLNSTWIRAAARLGAVPAASGFARFNSQTVERLPLPDGVLSDRALARIARAGRRGAALQEELDGMVSRHLGLSESAQSALRDFVRNGTDNRR